MRGEHTATARARTVELVGSKFRAAGCTAEVCQCTLHDSPIPRGIVSHFREEGRDHTQVAKLYPRPRKSGQAARLGQCSQFVECGLPRVSGLVGSSRQRTSDSRHRDKWSPRPVPLVMLFLALGTGMVLAVVNAPAILLQHTTLDGPGVTTGILLLSLAGFLIKGPRSRIDFPQRTMLRHSGESSARPHCRAEFVPAAKIPEKP